MSLYAPLHGLALWGLPQQKHFGLPPPHCFVTVDILKEILKRAVRNEIVHTSRNLSTLSCCT